MGVAVILIEGAVSRFDEDLADAGDRIPRIDAQVGQDLVDLGGIHLDRPQVRPRLPVELDILADEPPQHIEQPRHGFAKVQHLGHDGLLAGKGQQLPGEVGGALGGFADLHQVVMERPGRIHLRERQLRMPDDHPQHVVEVVGHAASQPPHRFHLVGLAELVFELGLVGDIAFDGNVIDDFSRGVAHGRDGRFFLVKRAVLALVGEAAVPHLPAAQHRPHPLVELRVLLAALEDPRILTGRFFAGVAGDLLERRVGVEDGGAGIGDHDGFGGLLDRRRQPFAFDLRPLALRYFNAHDH